jgi:tRNA dimethylallyltransferase
MNIGTAKPTQAEQAAVPHHLIDLVDPDEDFSLATYQDYAYAAISEITARGRVPLLVGGTGQYLAAVLQGWQIPRVAPHPEIRARLEQEAEQLGVPALHARLAQHDPTAAEGILNTNLRRIIRALEVYQVTGQPISAQQRMEAPPYRIQTIWFTRPVAELYRRIDLRVDQMMELGLHSEVRQLVEQGYSWELPAMSGLGYREFQPCFAGEQTLEQAVTRLKFDTHAFARRQPNWFRRLPQMLQIELEQPDVLDTLVQHAQEMLQAQPPQPH